MNYKALTVDQSHQKTNGTSLQGYIQVEFDLLRELFGNPHESDGYKTDAEWAIEFEDGTIATIYNYKDGHNYLGADGFNINQITNWHIGGKNKNALFYVQNLLNKFDPETELPKMYEQYLKDNQI